MLDILSYKQKLKDLRTEIDSWNREGVGGHFQVVWYTSKVDKLIKSLFWDIYGKRIPNFSLIALGGYGRKELNLASDIDLLFLWLEEPSEAEVESLSKFVQSMWDVGFEFSSSFRNLEETIESTSKDETLKLAILDARLIGGSYRPYKSLKSSFSRIFGDEPKKLIDLLEGWIDARSKSYGVSVQLIEPNVKESPGGLRDIHTIYWIGKLLYGIEDFRDLEKKGLLTTLEFETISNARDFLWRVRNSLHSIRGRKNDYLDLSVQPDVAYSLGYRKVDRFQPSLYLMKDFYKHVRGVRKVLRAFLTRVREEFNIGKDEAFGNFVKYIFEERFDSPSKLLFRVYKGLEIGVDFERIYRAFWIPPLYWRDQDMYNKDTRDMLIKIFNFSKSYPAIRFLHEIGFLSRLFPEFDRITGLLQLDLYHRYTVDEHTFLAIRNLEELPDSDVPLKEELMSSYGRVLEKSKKYILVLALLFHDIGKGKGRGHSARGMKIAVRYMEKLMFDDDDISMVSFLVKNHTLMAEYAFKRNIYDIGTITSFVDRVENLEKLDLLYLVTFADISAVSPNNWDEWKASNLMELYLRARDMLEKGKIELVSYDDIYMEVEKIMVNEGYTREKVRELWNLLPLDRGLYLLPSIIASILIGLDKVISGQEGIFAKFVEDGYDGSGKLVVVKPYGRLDFYKVVGSLTANAIDIWGVNLFECKNGLSVYIFELANMKEKMDLREIFRKFILKDYDSIDREAKRVRSRFLKREISVDIPTQISMNNTISPSYSIIEVKTRDRIGLLYDISKTLAEYGVEIHFVKAVTEGRRAIDVFYVTKNGEKLTDKEFLQIQKVLKQKIDNKF